MATFVKVFNVTDGVVASEVTPELPEQLYATKEELGQLFGCTPTDADIRFAMSIIHSFCGRSSLWPTEVIEGPYDIPYGRQETRLQVRPVISILECAGRFSMSRRDRQGWNSLYQSMNPLLILASNGIPQWTPLPISTIEYDAPTGIVYLPLSGMLLPYSLVRFRTIAGYISIPLRVKSALAEIINSVHNKGQSDRTRFSVGRISRQYAASSFLTPMAEQFLQPFRVQGLF